MKLVKKRLRNLKFFRTATWGRLGCCGWGVGGKGELGWEGAFCIFEELEDNCFCILIGEVCRGAAAGVEREGKGTKRVLHVRWGNSGESQVSLGFTGKVDKAGHPTIGARGDGNERETASGKRGKSCFRGNVSKYQCGQRGIMALRVGKVEEVANARKGRTRNLGCRFPA